MGTQRGTGRRVKGASVMVVAALLVLLLGGCSGGSDGGTDAMSGTAEDSGSDTLVGRDVPAADGGGQSEPDGGDVSTAGRTQVQTRAVISTGQVQLETDDLVEARSQVDRLLGRFGGFVAHEETHSDDDGRTSHSTLQLRVPSQHFETLMSSFADFATVVDTKRKAEDVTTEVIDVDSRIRTQEISLERLRKFLGQATKVADMIRLESEIASREAELASLRAQQDYLADQTSLATVTVRMALPPEKADEEDPLEDAGFLTGLRNGWEALTDVALVAATAVGALLPFLGVLALFLVPLVVWVRTGRRRRQPVTAPPPAS
jgi:Domain of unknown function (DUF4349)